MHSSISINKDTSSNLILSFHHLINSHNKQEPNKWLYAIRRISEFAAKIISSHLKSQLINLINKYLFVFFLLTIFLPPIFLRNRNLWTTQLNRLTNVTKRFDQRTFFCPKSKSHFQFTSNVHHVYYSFSVVQCQQRQNAYFRFETRFFRVSTCSLFF